MAQKKGEQGLAAWCRNQRPGAATEYQLVTETLGDGTPLSTWGPETINELGWEALARDIFSAAEADAEVRGTSMQYAVRHVDEGKVRGKCLLKFVRPRAVEEQDEEMRLANDGSLQAGYALSLRQNAELHKFALDAMRQQANLASSALNLLEQAHKRIGALEDREARRVDEQITQALEDAAEKADALTKRTGSASDELGQFVNTFAPRLAEKLVEKYGDQAVAMMMQFVTNMNAH